MGAFFTSSDFKANVVTKPSVSQSKTTGILSEMQPYVSNYLCKMPDYCVNTGPPDGEEMQRQKKKPLKLGLGLGLHIFIFSWMILTGKGQLLSVDMKPVPKSS